MTEPLAFGLGQDEGGEEEETQDVPDALCRTREREQFDNRAIPQELTNQRQDQQGNDKGK